jgi:glucan biosynthesis protein C
MSSESNMTMPHTIDGIYTPAQEEAQRGVRLFFVDHLRAALTMLVIIHHLAVTYGVVSAWYYLEPPNDTLTQPLLLLLILFNQSFFMGLFFLLAGYFTPSSYDRKGAGAFLKDRLLRLGLPLLAFMVLLAPLSSLLGYSSVLPFIGPQEPLPLWQHYLLTMSPGPLWFVEALLIFVVCYALWRKLTSAQATQDLQASSPPGYRAILAFILALALTTFALRLWVPIGWSLPILGFPTPAHLPQYISFFILGIVAYRRSWLLSIPDSMGRVGLAAALITTLFLLPTALIVGAPTDPTQALFTGGPYWQAFVYALWEAISCVGMSLGLLTLFRKRFNRQGAAGRFLSAQAYAVYIIHAPVIVGLAYVLGGFRIYPLLKFALVALIAIPLCFVCAYLLRRLPFARSVL